MEGDVFDVVAERYDAARPGYPDEAIDALLALAGVESGAAVLEIGAGTGQLTRALVDRGMRLSCIEPGGSLAAILRRKLPGVEVIERRFEDWEPGERRFDLVVSATAFHWLDQGRAIATIRRLLRAGGAMALLWNEHVTEGDEDQFARHLQPIYDRLGQGTGPPGPPPSAAEVPDRRPALREHGVGEMDRRRFAWTASYTSREFVDLVSTYSGHITLPAEERRTLLRALRDAIDALPDGRLVKHHATDLYVARRTELG